jgi:hypothetical protein
MRRKTRSLTPYQQFFCPPNPCGGGSPIDAILAEAGNVLVTQGLQKLGQSLADRLGLVDPYEQIRLNRSMLQLREIEARIAKAE